MPFLPTRPGIPLDDEPDPREHRAGSPAASLWVVLGLAGLVVAGAVAFLMLRPRHAPAPAEIAADPLLVRGREVYLDRCVSCHGPEGLGNGPLARTLTGPPVGNLTDADWKHGDAPGQVLGLIRDGVRGTSMPAWGPYLPSGDVRSVAAYVYHLAGRGVPEGLRAGD